MKARFVTKAALSALALAFAGTLPGVAQQTAAPAVDSVKASAVEKVFIVKMADIVQAGLKAGALDVKAVSGVLNEAVKADVSDRVMGAMVSMGFPFQRSCRCFRRCSELRIQYKGGACAQCDRFRCFFPV